MMRGSDRRLPLRGPDLVLMALHRRGQRSGLSTNALVVVQCEGSVDLERVGRALDRFLDVCPWPAARLRRPFPWGSLHWAAGRREALIRPSVQQHAVASPDELREALTADLNEAIDPTRDAPLRVRLLDGAGPLVGQGFLVLTWFHPLMDARG